MIRFPTDPADATGGLVRAGGTDLTERRHLGLAPGDLVDLRDIEGLDAIAVQEDGGLRIGAMVTVRQLAESPVVRGGWPGLAEAAGGLATPQIRARATVGGNLLQDVRCWYYRSDRFRCLKSGGDTCLARAGDHRHHSVVSLGPCIAVHPSTLAMAFLAWDAAILVEDGDDRTVSELMGSPGDPSRCHTLEDGALLTHVVLPPPTPGERSAYHRTIHRSRAEWPIVEAVVAVVIEDDTLSGVRLAVGGIANRPLRLTDAEDRLRGRSVSDPDLAGAFSTIEGRAQPLSAHNAYRAELIVPSLLDTLSRVLS